MTYARKVIRITAEDSPNVKRGLAQLKAGQKPDDRVLVDGVLTYGEYVHRRKTWDEFRQCVGLDAQFFKGKEARLWPTAVLLACSARARDLRGKQRRAKAIGVDTAEGGDSTSMVAGDELGVIAARSVKTPNTDVICGMVIAFAREMGCDDPSAWWFDRGGGGLQHADRLRGMGMKVKTVGFGEKPTLEIKRGLQMLEDRKEVREEQYVYVNMRAEMYHQFALACEDGYAVPDHDDALTELHRQMSLVPKVLGDWSMWDGEGRIRMLPKNKRVGGSDELCLTDVIGHSPDELDAAAVMYHGLTVRKTRAKIIVG